MTQTGVIRIDLGDPAWAPLIRAKYSLFTKEARHHFRWNVLYDKPFPDAPPSILLSLTGRETAEDFTHTYSIEPVDITVTGFVLRLGLNRFATSIFTVSWLAVS